MLEDYKSLFKEVEFQDAVKTKRVCLFLGSGVGFNIGMPDWKGLAKEIVLFSLKEKIITRSEKLNLMNINNPLKIISICTDRIDKSDKKNKFNKLFKQLFYKIPKDKYKRNSIYANLNKLYKEKAVLILQTNYDVMIEKYQSKEEGKNRNFYIPYKDNNNISKNNITNSIVYLHGRFSGDSDEYRQSTYQDLILNKRQYNRVYVLENTDEYKKQREFINYLLKEFYIIFLGYSLNDAEILQMIANKPKTENYIRIRVIVDNCLAKNLENEFNSAYLKSASNDKIKTYVYDTETSGIEAGFEEVIKNLTSNILETPDKNSCIIKYTNPKEVDFG